MANAKEIQNRMKSIQDTMKITKAMYMMSSMKMRKAKQQLENTEPFFRELRTQISSILLHFPDMRHLYFDNRSVDKRETVKKKGVIVITGDKGMAGAYNHNVIKETQELLKRLGESCLYVVGELGRNSFRAQGLPVEPDFDFSPSRPSIHRARVIAELIVDLYKREELDEVYLVYTRMINSMQEEVEVEQFLPLKTHEFLKQELQEQVNQGAAYEDEMSEADDWFLLYPSPKKVLEKLVYNYITGYLYCALVEGSASEENARMMAMRSATDNAEKMLAELSMQYNRIRQASITQEITEVIGGARALKQRKLKQVR